MNSAKFAIPSFMPAVFLMLLVIQVACTPWGSAEEGTSTRARAQAMEQANKQRLEEIATVLGKFTSHPGVQILVNQLFLTTSPVFPIPPVTREQLSPHMGVFEEITPGIFELVASPGDGIVVTYLDDTKIGFNLQFVGELNNQLAHFRLSFGEFIDLYYEILGLNSSGLVDGIHVRGLINYTLGDGTPIDLSALYYFGGRFMNPCHWNNDPPRAYLTFCDESYSNLEYIRGRLVEIRDQNGWNLNTEPTHKLKMHALIAENYRNKTRGNVLGWALARIYL
jgi:hypothetical protein